MGVYTSYLSNAIANWVRGTAMPTAPTTLYLALSTTAINGDGTGITEPSGGAYARQIVTMTAPSFGESTGSVISLSGNVIYPTATGTWGNITHLALFTAVSGGSMLHRWQAPVAKNIGVGDTYTVAAGDFSIAYK